MIAGNIYYTFGPSWYCIPTYIVHSYAYNTFKDRRRNKKHYVRREILEILKRNILPAAISLETITVSTLLVLQVRILDILTKHT